MTVAEDHTSRPIPEPIDMSDELSQLRTLAGMANDLASGIDQRGMKQAARTEMNELIALTAALHAFAAQAYKDSDCPSPDGIDGEA